MWAEKINFESMNAIIWLWGYLSEILDEKNANPASLESGVLQANLQHALCVLEVCATHSEKNDFDHHGWRVAKLYARKVQAKLDRGLIGWKDFTEFKTNPHPSELIAAKQELEPKMRKKGFERASDRGYERASDRGSDRGSERDRGRGDRPLCTTWNSSKTEGKCDWQVRNPDKGRCNRRHDCNYCTEKGHGTLFHQRSFCPKRVAAGDT